MTPFLALKYPFDPKNQLLQSPSVVSNVFLPQKIHFSHKTTLET